MLANPELQRTPLAVGAGLPRAEEKYARASLGQVFARRRWRER
jgi:hypothetical protein